MSTLVTTALRHNASASNNMVLDSSGNVGIGTASPSRKLDVVGSAAFTNANVRFRLNNTAGTSSTLLSGADSGSVFTGAETNTPLYFITDNTERGRFDTSGNFQFNSGYGSVATAFGCRAWICFNGTGTISIRASGNVTSIVDNGVGDYTINFTNAMPDANYSTVGSGRSSGVGNGTAFGTITSLAGSVRVNTSSGALNSSVDTPEIGVAIFR